MHSVHPNTEPTQRNMHLGSFHECLQHECVFQFSAVVSSWELELCLLELEPAARETRNLFSAVTGPGQIATGPKPEIKKHPARTRRGHPVVSPEPEEGPILRRKAQPRRLHRRFLPHRPGELVAACLLATWAPRQRLVGSPIPGIRNSIGVLLEEIHGFPW